MAKCDICGKAVTNGNKISIARYAALDCMLVEEQKEHGKPNLRTVRIKVNGENKKMSVCSKCLRSAS